MIEEVIWGLVIEGAVPTTAIVEALEVIEDRGCGGTTAGEGLAVLDQVGLDGSKRAMTTAR